MALRDDGGCNLHKDQVFPPMCIKGNVAKNPKYALLGDSHASALSIELAKAMSNLDESFLQFTKNVCPLALTFQSKKRENCGNYIENVFFELSRSNVETVIVSARWSYYLTDDSFSNGAGGVEIRDDNRYTALNLGLEADAAMRRDAILVQYKDGIERLIGLSKKVILIYPIPEQGWNVPKVMAKRKLVSKYDAPDFGVRMDIIKKRNSDVVALFDSIPMSDRLVKIRPFDIFCDTFIAKKCAASINGTSLYYDDDHLSNDGARFIVDKIRPHLKLE